MNYLLAILLFLFLVDSLRHYLLIKKAVKLSHLEKDWTGEFWVGSSSKPEFYLLILGDSIAAGIGVDELSKTVGGMLAEKLSDKYHVKLVNRGQSGIWTTGLAQEEIKGPWDLIVVITGSNDLTHRIKPIFSHRALNKLARHLNANSKKVILAGPGDVSALTTLPFWYRFPLKFRQKDYSQMMAKIAASHKIFYANPLKFPFKDSYFAKDHTHPNLSGTKIWADVIWEQIEAKYPEYNNQPFSILKLHKKIYVELIFWIHTCIVIGLLTMGLFLPLWAFLLVIILQRIQLYAFNGCSITRYEQEIDGIPRNQLFFQYVSKRFFNHDLSRYGNHIAYLSLFTVSVLLAILKNLNIL